VLLDGAMGSEIHRRGVEMPLPLWSCLANSTAPKVVKQIHRDYIGAGAEIITTNTFRTNTRVFEGPDVHKKSRDLTMCACDLAIEAREEAGASNVLIGGSLAPVEDCYEPSRVPPDEELINEHGKFAGYLAESGVDFIFIETMNCIREARIALKSAAEAGAPYAISFVCGESGALLSEESLGDVFTMLGEFEPVFVCVNCRPPDQIDPSFTLLAEQSQYPFGVYANGAGCPEARSGWEFERGGNPCGKLPRICEKLAKQGSNNYWRVLWYHA